MSKEEKETENVKKTNHFTCTIRQCDVETYKQCQTLCSKLGCSMKDLVWYALNTIIDTPTLQPKSFGLSK